MTCGVCGLENAPGRKYCGECGAPLERACPACGAANEPAMKFCGECGGALNADGAPSAQPVPVAVTRDQPDVHDRLGSLIAEPYEEPPFGSDANDARVPAPRSPAD